MKSSGAKQQNEELLKLTDVHETSGVDSTGHFSAKMSDEENHESKSIRQFINRPFVITITAILMGSFQYGYNVGVATNTEDLVKNFMNRTIKDRDGSYPSEDSLTNIWAISVAILFLGGCVGVFSNKWIVQYLSRKRGEVLNIILGAVAISVEVSSRPAEIWELFLVGRLLTGVHCGIYSGLTSVYMTEASPTEIRGALNTVNVLGIYFGIWVGQVIGFPIILGTDDLWHYAYALSFSPCLIQLVLLPFCVESPRYLMMVLKDEAKARQALQTLRQSHDVEDEIEEMREEMKKDIETVSIIQLFRHPPYRRATLLAVMSHASLQLCGIVAVMSYTNSLFQDSAGLSEETAAYVASSSGLVLATMTVVVVPLSETAGRRILHLVGHSGIVCCCIMLTVCFALTDTVDGLGKASIAFVLLFIVFFSIGPGAVPWMVLGDVFTQETRPSASAITLVFHWMGAFVVGYIFPPMKIALQDFIFLPFAVYVTLATIYFYFYHPETKGKTAQEVAKLFEKPGDDVGRRRPETSNDSVLLKTSTSPSPV